MYELKQNLKNSKLVMEAKVGNIPACAFQVKWNYQGTMPRRAQNLMFTSAGMFIPSDMFWYKTVAVKWVFC